MKTFRRVQVGIAIVALWTAIAVCDSYEATSKEIFTGVVLAVLAGMVVVSVLIEKTKEESK